MFHTAAAAVKMAGIAVLSPRETDVRHHLPDIRPDFFADFLFGGIIGGRKDLQVRKGLLSVDFFLSVAYQKRLAARTKSAFYGSINENFLP